MHSAAISATDVIAVYAAFVATASVGWQIYAARRARRPDVDVTVHLAGVPSGDDVVWMIAIKVANRSPVAIGVSGVGLRLQDRGGTLAKARLESLDTLPGTVAPFHTGAAYLTRDYVERVGFTLTEPIVAYADLATGTVPSKPTRLLKPQRRGRG